MIFVSQVLSGCSAQPSVMIHSCVFCVLLNSSHANIKLLNPFLREEIMDLKKIKDTHPKYQALWEALRDTLVVRDHEEEVWAKLDIKQYYYVHKEHDRVTDSTSTSTTLSGKASGKGHQQLLNGDKANVTVLYPEWNVCKQKNTVNKSGAGKLNVVTTEIGKVMASLRVDSAQDHSEEVAKLGTLQNSLRECTSDMDMLAAKFDALDKSDGPAIAALNEEFDTVKGLCEAHLDGWKEYRRVRKEELSAAKGSNKTV